MFQKAVIRLTLWYLALIMVLCAVFSVALYQVSTRELDANQQHLEDVLQHSIFLNHNAGFVAFNQQRLAEIDQSRQHIEYNLIDFTFIILLIGGAVSYLLARRTLQPIEESLEAQQRFTADASHELRTPLTAMKTELEVALRDKSLSLDQSKDLHRSSLEEIRRLEILSNGLLQLAKQDASPAVTHATCQVQELIGEAVKRVSSAAHHKNIVIAVKSAPTSIEGEEWSLTELLFILLDNAIKYSPENSQVQVTTERNNGMVSISITDEGVGIPVEALPHIFEHFYRADISRTKGSSSGYGLGLSIAKKIVERHQGDIEVKSVLNTGSTFSVVLPVRQPVAWTGLLDRNIN
jgi:two-component system sensor histidine kinase CiaH